MTLATSGKRAGAYWLDGDSSFSLWCWGPGLALQNSAGFMVGDVALFHLPMFGEILSRMLVVSGAATAYESGNSVGKGLSFGWNSRPDFAGFVDDYIAPFKEGVAADAADQHRC